MQREDLKFLKIAGCTIVLEQRDEMRDLDAIGTDSKVRYVHQAVVWQAVRNENSDGMSVKEVRKLPSGHVYNEWHEERVAAGTP